MNKFWNWDVTASGDNELILDGVIASESWFEDEVTPKMFRDDLEKHPGAVTVRINSPGGDVFAGIAIYNMLNEHQGDVTVKVDGVAASIASLVAMAGDNIIMLPGSMIMVHNPWTFAAGNAEDLEQVVEALKKTGESMLPIYVARTGQTEGKVKELLQAETWMTAEDAVELGFADEAIKAKASISDSIKNALSFATDVQSAIMQPVMSMKAKKAEVANVTTKPKASDEDPVETPDAPAKDETEAPDSTESEPPVEGTEEESKSTNNGEQMSKPEEDNKTPEATATAPVKPEASTQETIAKDQVIEPKAQAKPAEAKPVLKSYLKSEEAMNEFASILQANPGDMGGDSSKAVRASWKKHLEVKAGVTNPEIFLPTPLVEAIQNAFEDGGEIWNRVSKVGADVWNAAWDTEDDENSNDGRARGYNRADEPEKQEQVLTFDDRILRPQFVYKYITLNKEDIKEQRSTGALVTYVLSELPQRIVREVERAIVLGDGRGGSDDYKIKEGDPRGFYPILADVADDNFFAGEVVLDGDEAAAEAVALARDELRTPGEAVLIAKKGYATRARFAKNTDGDYLFPIGTKATDLLDVGTIIEPDWFNDTNSPDYDAVLVVLSGYKVVGDTTIEGFQNFILKTNKQEYLQEIWAGGGLSQRKAAIAIPATASS